jgi:hypothetical protein
LAAAGPALKLKPSTASVSVATLPASTTLMSAKPPAFESHEYILVRSALAAKETTKALKSEYSSAVIDILKKGVWDQ